MPRRRRRAARRRSGRHRLPPRPHGRRALILTDVNVLVHAFRSDAAGHRQHKAWLESLVNGPTAYGVALQVLASVVRVYTVSEVIYLEAADKYVTVVTAAGEALVRMSLRELAARIDGIELMQVHRSVVVNAGCIASATRDELGHYTLSLRGSRKAIQVSRAFAHLFRAM